MSRRMESIVIENFMGAVNEAAQQLKRVPIGKVTLVHHNDADGIASGAILKRGLERAGFPTENIPIERIHPLILPRIHTPDRKLIIYADLAGQSSDMSRHLQSETFVIILDHHPPFEAPPSNLIHINPEIFGIDGDTRSAAATVAFFFVKALSPANDDLAALAMIGAIGDGQTVDGKLLGLNQMAETIAVSKGLVRITEDEGDDPYRFVLFGADSGHRVSLLLVELAVNGYYRGGADIAIRFCLEGPTPGLLQFALEMRRVQQERFDREKERLRLNGISREEKVQWADVEDRFYPLGLKAIGIFCSEIAKTEWVDRDKYIVGFQDVPKENPYLGKFEWEETKASLRVPPDLHRAIGEGLARPLSEIVPIASRQVGGISDACHRYSAACTIGKKKKKELIRSLASLVTEKL
jgi:single-stranded-DNA-specific exonuclease